MTTPTTVIVVLAPGATTGKVRSHLRIGLVSPVAVAETALNVYASGIKPEPYVVIGGRPIAAGDFGATLRTRGGAVLTPQVPQPIEDDVNVSSDLRWQLPFTGTVWSPTREPYATLGTASITTSYAATTHDPIVDYVYDHQHRRGIRRRAALSFGGNGYSLFNPGAGRLPSATLAFVAVMGNNNRAYSGVFASDNRAAQYSGEPLQIRYYHGRWDVYQDARRVVSYNAKVNVNQAQLFMISCDAATDTGRLVIFDSSMHSVKFNIKNLDFISLYGVLGAVYDAAGAAVYRARMDVLEVDYWSRALTGTEMREQAETLAEYHRLGR